MTIKKKIGDGIVRTNDFEYPYSFSTGEGMFDMWQSAENAIFRIESPRVWSFMDGAYNKYFDHVIVPLELIL